MKVLLMTGTIDSGYFGNVQTKVSNTLQRKEQYYQTIEKYIKLSNFDSIIFAENSQYPFDEVYFKDLSKQYGKQFEYLKVLTDVEKTKKKGKSYGEAHLIKSAVLNSKLIKEAETFYKVTGRVYVENINSIINEKDRNEFICHNVYKSLYTVFFKMRIDTFKNKLMNAEEECNEQDGWKFIETIYYQHLKDEKIYSFRRYPKLDGIIGSNGLPYNRSKKNIFIKNVLLKLGYYRVKKDTFLKMKFVEKLETGVRNITERK